MRTLLALLAISLLLTACGGQAPPAGDTADTQPSTEQTVDKLETDLEALDSFDDELDFSDLDALDEELNFE